MGEDSSAAKILHRLITTGLGFVAWSEEKAKAFIDELVKKGEISCAEGEGLLKKMIERIESSSKEIETKISELIKKYIKNTDICMKSKNFKEMDKRITKLEEEIKRLSKEKNKPKGLTNGIAPYQTDD
ncbi:MAG: phasin family protein [bacterium]